MFKQLLFFLFFCLLDPHHLMSLMGGNNQTEPGSGQEDGGDRKIDK